MALVVQSLSERVHDLLRERLVSRHIAPGEVIRQDTLAGELGVSKIPIREALSRLEEAQLVERVTHRGFSAAPLSLVEADDIFSLRILIEPPTAALGAELAADADRAAVRTAAQRLAAAGEDLRTTAGERLKLLLAMAGPSHRPTTQIIISQLFFRSERYVPARLETAGVLLGEVDALTQSWLDGDGDAVRSLYAARLEARWAKAREEAGA